MTELYKSRNLNKIFIISPFLHRKTMSDRISAFFDNKTVLLTGSTGFLGKTLLEKLLRSCINIRKIYVLIRQKNDTGPALRLHEMFKSAFFRLVTKQQGPEIFKKVVPISGDLSDPDLGLSLFDRLKICKEVEIIFHCGGIDNFEADFKEVVITNVRGTQLMLELAKQCDKLQVFSYLSSVFCHIHEESVKEQAYQPPKNPYEVIKICEYLQSDEIELIKHKILEQFPNSYLFTKALGESLVAEKLNQLPVTILRTSVVMPTWKEPLPGYCDDTNSPVGLLIGIGKGYIRSIFCKNDSYLNCLPADIAANAILFSTFDFITSDRQRQVYNVLSPKNFKILIDNVIKMSQNLVKTTLPFGAIFWYPNCTITQSKIKHYVRLGLFQLLPGLIIDALLILYRQKPFMMDIQKRTLYTYKMCEFYTQRKWSFENSGSLEALKHLNSREREIYKLDTLGGNMENYILSCIHSARLYLLRESDDEITVAKRQLKLMWFLSVLVKIVFVWMILYILCENI